MNQASVIGFAGWSGSGKTTLIARLIPVLVARGQRVASLKHSHHDIEMDRPGTDSQVHRQAGASEVILSSARRWVQIHENGRRPEPRLPDLLRRFSPCDLVIVEGFKRAGHPKLEVFRAPNGKPPLHPEDPRILAVASDVPFPDTGLPWAHLDDVEAIADLVLAMAEPIDDVIAKLDDERNDGPVA